jgi:hypothetical protein
VSYFCTPILFAICTNTMSKLCKTYVMVCGRALSGAPLSLADSRPAVDFGNEAYKINLTT